MRVYFSFPHFSFPISQILLLVLLRNSTMQRITDSSILACKVVGTCNWAIAYNYGLLQVGPHPPPHFPSPPPHLPSHFLG